MSTEKNKPDPSEAEQVKEDAAAAQEDVLSKSMMDALLNAKPEQLIEANPDAEVIKGTMNRPGCWAHGPAMFEFLAAAYRRLVRVAGYAGFKNKQVDRVHARLLEGTKLLIIKPALASDLSAFPVNRYGSSVMFNLITLLSEHGLLVDSKHREWYEVAYIPKASPLWPGLVIDLGHHKLRRKKGEPDETAEATATTKKAGASRKKKGEASSQKPQAPEGQKPQAPEGPQPT